MAGDDALQAAKRAALTALLKNASILTTEGIAATTEDDLSGERQGLTNDAATTGYPTVDRNSVQRHHKPRTRPRRKRHRKETTREVFHPNNGFSKTYGPHAVNLPKIAGAMSEPLAQEQRSGGPLETLDPSEAPTTVDYVLEPVVMLDLPDVSLKTQSPGDAKTSDAQTKKNTEAEKGEDVSEDNGSEALAQLRAALTRFNARTTAILNSEEPDVDEDPIYPDFASILHLKSLSRPADKGNDAENAGTTDNGGDGNARASNESNEVFRKSDPERSGEHNGIEALSRKKLKEARRELVSVLKAASPDPSVVDPWDVTATDPLLLCTLKAVRNSVPVPINWRQKRKYLQNKRGLSKRVLPLPPTIEALGIGTTRDAQLATDSRKSLKQRQRERMRAKTGAAIGAADIDDRRLRQAFRQLGKPSLTALGDVYFELRELEVDARSFVPGTLSDELRSALGMQKDDPPPWIVAMQRWGPPPGWPGLRIPGVNAPIPTGAQFGYQAGGWGKPPVDFTGRPMYGDVFNQGLVFEVFDERFDVSHEMKRRRWGSVQPVQELSSDEQDGDAGDDDEGNDQRDSDDVAPQDNKAGNEGVGNRTGGERNRGGDNRSSSSTGYQILKQRREWSGGSGLMASSHLYDMEGVKGGNERHGQGRNDERDGAGRNDRGRDGYKNPKSKF